MHFQNQIIGKKIIYLRKEPIASVRKSYEKDSKSTPEAYRPAQRCSILAADEAEGQGEYQLQRDQGYRGARRPFYRRYYGPPPRGYYDGGYYGYQGGPPRGGPRRGRGGRGRGRGARRGRGDEGTSPKAEASNDTLKSEPSSTTVESKEE